MRSISPARIRLARAIAVAADVVQLAVFPAFIQGFLSPFDDLLDAVVCLVLIYLVGWHIAFLPTFLVKEIPFANLAPTWTIAVFIATRGSGRSGTDLTLEKI